ncbi:MAG: ATP-dependent DNA helicase RecG, partial [Acidobacteriota bacterium]|nr:ATP-dependent DNA helicase RecG [Acidobacteriota bacterium]
MLRGESRLENLGKEIGLPYRQVKAVGAAGLETVEDLLLYLPFRYEDRRRFETLSGLVVDGPPATLSVVVASTKLIRTRRRGFSIFEAMLEDESGKRRAVWYNQPFLARVIKEDDRLLVFCRASKGRYKDPILENPDYEKLDDEADETERGIHTGRIVPVYRKLGTLTSKALRHMVHRVLDSLDADGLPDRVPDEIRRRAGVWGRGRAIRQIHFPDADTPMLRLDDHSTEAQRALAFEEAFLLQAALRLRQIGVCERKRGIAYEVTDALRGRLARLLPFKLTDAQKRVLQEIGADLRRPHPMHRLLQGDVGSGKTIVAFLALLVAVDNGFQGALMAPTEILA